MFFLIVVSSSLMDIDTSGIPPFKEPTVDRESRACGCDLLTPRCSKRDEDVILKSVRDLL